MNAFEEVAAQQGTALPVERGFPIIRGEVTTPSGVRLCYEVAGDADRPVIVFANGIGVDIPGATSQREALAKRYRFLTWAYRGIGRSLVPHSEVDVSMEQHAEDLERILDALHIERALLVGWSMGSQVNLELIRRQPARAAGYVALLGAAGRPFRGPFPAPIDRAARHLFSLLAAYPSPAQAALDLAVTLPDVAFQVLSLAAFVGRDVDRVVFEHNVRSVQAADRRLYLRTMVALADHDASDVLPLVRCKSLVIAGTRDTMTPPRMAKELASALPDSDYREVPGGTHFAPIEQPGLINGWLLDFADEVFAPVVVAR
ncbi:MAG: alpha/beta hydrolase [Deltaproteobacteria bacterium]|nr:alpha/beta hydrolase [Deltaproteobacteria bacterium]